MSLLHWYSLINQFQVKTKISKAFVMCEEWNTSVRVLLQTCLAYFNDTIGIMIHIYWGASPILVQRFSRAGPRGRGREWATLGVHPLYWLLSNNRLEEVCSTLTKGTFSSRLLLSNQDKGCTPSVAHSLPLPLGPALLNLSSVVNTHDQRFSKHPWTRIWHGFAPNFTT